MVRPKKYLGQHFLKDKNLAAKIVNSLLLHNQYPNLLEIGPGKGVLTQFLFGRSDIQTWIMDIDEEAIQYLTGIFPERKNYILKGDFLAYDLSFLGTQYGIIGNFPYNISSQILFRVLDNRDKVEELVGMFQKEVADRLNALEGNKTYGKLTVLLKAFYKVEYLFTVRPGAFYPVPKVNSSVIRLTRNEVKKLNCNEKLFFDVVKSGFQNRRKILRNALKSLNLPSSFAEEPLLKKRAEQLSVKEFEYLCLKIEESAGKQKASD